MTVARAEQGNKVSMHAKASDPLLDSLTPRERDIVRGVVEGLSNREIARRCGVSDRTVRNRLTVIFDKRGVRRPVPQLVGTVLTKTESRRASDK